MSPARRGASIWASSLIGTRRNCLTDSKSVSGVLENAVFRTIVHTAFIAR